MSRSTAALLFFCAASHALAAEPAKKPLDPSVSRLGAVFAGGVLDLMTQPKRDVTASFGALVSAPLGYPKDRRAAEFTALSASLPRQVRELNGKLAADGPMLVSVCAQPDWDSKWKLEAILQGRERVWSLTFTADTNVFGVPASGTHPPNFFFAGLEPSKVTAAERVAAAQGSCAKVKRDAAGEVFFEGEAAPVKFEATLPTPLPAGSDHLLDFADDPDGAVAGLMPVETFANLHREFPRPRAAGVLSLALTADALDALGRLTLVASTASGAVLFVEGLERIISIGFRNGYFTTPQLVTPATALTGPWSKATWSLVEPRMPAEVLLDMTPGSARCLDALPKVPAGDLATNIQRCFDLSLADAGASFRVRRERWLEAVRAHETATSARVEEFCADQAALAALPFFQRKPATKNRDAGPLLTTVLGWEKRTGAKDFNGTLRLPPDLDQQQAAAGFMELSDKDLAAAASTDLSFFSKLQDFERWDLAGAHGPLDQGTTLNAAEAPLPVFQRLTLAARLHLRRGAKNGKLVQAAKDVRHAARLAFSTENLIGQSVAVNLLSFEWRAWDWAQRHRLKTPGWTPIDEPTVERARRVVRTAPAFFSPLAQEATFARVTACDQVTRCAAITEVVAVSAGLESLLREPWRARYAALLQASSAANDRCSFALARHWSSRSMVDVDEARLSRNQEVIAGGMMSRAASGFYLPALTRFYPR